MKYKIQYIKKKEKGGYIGMNEKAARAHNIPWKHCRHPEHTIEVYRKQPKDVRLATLHHEELEEYLMRSKHFGYHRAHQNALRYEKINKPLPQKNIKRFLKKEGFKIR